MSEGTVIRLKENTEIEHTNLRALQAHWDEVLREEGFGMSEGSNQLVQYFGTPGDLEPVESAYVASLACGTGGGRRVKPKGSRPE